MGKLAFRFLLGLIAGGVAWMIWEPSYPKNLSGSNSVELYMVLTAGVFIGGAVAGLNGFLQGGRKHTLMGLGLGALFGMVGISLGYSLGGSLVNAMFGGMVFVNPTTPLPVAIFARIIALLPTAAFLGAAVGMATLNPKRAVQGLIGGALAGVVTGGTFDLLSAVIATPILAAQGQQTGDVGGVARAITFAVTGGTIGLFIGLVDLLARQAWVRLQLGRNEGKEWSLDYSQNFLGRSESAQIPLFGDPNVAPMHACISKQGGQYVLFDGGSPIGTAVNGQRVQSVALTPGSIIQIGGFTLEFLMRGAQRSRAPVAPVAAPYVPTQTSQPYGQPAYGQQPMAQPVYAGQPQPNMDPTVAVSAGMLNPTVAMPGAGGIPQLVAIDGPLAGQRFPIVGPIELGRASAQVAMGYDQQSSRRHAVVMPGPAGIQVQDLGSTNGTLVNGQKVSVSPVWPGDIIKIGSTQFRIE
jgi:pSer/pThr/pTyr-binding forkhead associated (FHA) protein